METYELGQTFEDTYPPDAARWCNKNGAIIVECEPQDGKRIFQIQEIPAPPLDEVKADKIAELKNERNTREEAPVEYGGKLWDFDSKARDRITAAATALEIGGVESIEWTAHDDTSARMNVVDLKGIVAAAALRGDELHKKYRELRDRANAAETAEEVNAVSWGD